MTITNIMTSCRYRNTGVLACDIPCQKTLDKLQAHEQTTWWCITMLARFQPILIARAALRAAHTSSRGSTILIHQTASQAWLCDSGPRTQHAAC